MCFAQSCRLPILSVLCLYCIRAGRNGIIHAPPPELPSLRDSLFRNTIKASGRNGFQVASRRDGSRTAELGHTYSKRLPNRDASRRGPYATTPFPHTNTWLLPRCPLPTDWTLRWAGPWLAVRLAGIGGTHALHSPAGAVRLD
ncbi:hypothetical protein F5883DRAFT_553803 [Diaporthe sp. PMI_573]|nr:hypothetical protein F5883DRAFT_553803 [Diaporthaceae sp. PMI_573]